MNQHEIIILGARKPTEECLFEIGDIVKLKTGNSPQRIVKIRWDQNQKIWKVFAYYLSSDKEIKRIQEVTGNYDIPDVFLRRPRDQHDFELYQPTEEKETVMADLYQTKSTEPRFGTKLTENSQGQFVLEMKGEGGKVEAFNPEDLELVVPYTIQLDCVVPGESGMHIQCEKGKVEKNDLLMSVTTGRIFRVSNVDTKNRSPKAGPFQFLKIQGERITL